MSWILNCLVVQHDWRLTLLATGVCVTALATCITLIGAARHAGARTRLIFGAAAGVVGGLASGPPTSWRCLATVQGR